jgi:hypothetical protein
VTIESDVRSWSKEVLEVPGDLLGGLPPCPYAKEAWKKNKVLVVEVESFYKSSENYCKLFEELNKDLIIVASFNIPEPEDFYEFVENSLNVQYPKLHCMGFHPSYGAEEANLDFLTDNDWESSVEENYSMIFIQDLKKVVQASDKLESLGYYKAYPKEEYETLVEDRKRKYLNAR